MNMLIICVLLVLYISIITAAFVVGCIILTRELKFNRILKEKSMFFNMNVNKDMMNIVDQFIEDSIMQYRLKYLTENDEIYLTAKKQEEMVRSVLKDVLENMSPSLYEKMTLVYNKNKLEDIIYLKVSTSIISFIGSINGQYNE